MEVLKVKIRNLLRKVPSHRNCLILGVREAVERNNIHSKLFDSITKIHIYRNCNCITT